jgi:glycolate oxidase FAD binding subunit
MDMTVAQVSASSLEEFAVLVGTEDPVCVAGGRTQWDVGGLPVNGTREVVAPAGVLLHEPAEMIVRVRAGTTVAALNSALAEGGQMVPLDPVDPTRATVGGVLAVGHSGLRRLRYGPVRDTVLEARFVSGAGRLIKAGGPVVKNVTGFDLCRLLVGSLGTLGLLAEFVLRCQPVPLVSRWVQSVEPDSVDPFEVFGRLYRASSVLWDGHQVSVLLEGHPDDVDAQAREVLGPAFAEVAGPPDLPVGGRLSLPPGSLRDLPVPPTAPAGRARPGESAADGSAGPPGSPAATAGPAGPPGSAGPGGSAAIPADGSAGPPGAPAATAGPSRPRVLAGPAGSVPVAAEPGEVGGWLAEVGVGTVYATNPATLAAAVGAAWPRGMALGVAALHQELKRRFDPDGRLNPGRNVARA